MRIGRAELAPRPALAALAGLGLALGLAFGPVTEALDAAGRIAAGREALARAREASARPPVPPPLAGAGPDALAAALRNRLDTLAAGRAVVIDRAELEADPARPALPRLRAALRATEEGMVGFLHALETEAPLVAVEEASLEIARPADPEFNRPTVMRLVLTVRGVLLPGEPEPGSAAPSAGRRTAP